MRLSSIAISALILSGLWAADAQVVVGGDFGRSWLNQYGDQSTASNNTNDLWSWGGNPRGYSVIGGDLVPTAFPDVWYYPGFMTNGTPIYINATPGRSATGLPVDFFSPDYVYYYDPWTLAQTTERPVVVKYIGEPGRGVLV